jgi:magnesium transporter
MIKAINCRLNHNHVFTTIEDLDEVSQLIQDKNNLVWLDLQNSSPEELQKVADEFSFHPLAVEDASHPHQRPKIEEYDKFFLVIFYTIKLDDKHQHLHVQELAMFVGANYLVTVHEEPIRELEEAEKRWTRNADEMDRGIGVLVYSMLDTIVDNYFPVVDSLVDVAEDLEDFIFQGKAGQAALTAQLLELKKLFLLMRKITAPERDVLNVLTNRDSPIFSERNLVYFRDVYDHIIRVSDTLDLYRDQLSSTLDANLSVASNDLNKVMRTLTATSIILMTDALIAGIYGMNFDNIPELHWPYGYFYALALMLGLSLFLFFIFKRRNWF